MRPLSALRLLRSLYLLYFSQPAPDRVLYRAIRARPVKSIVEIGIDLPVRTRRILEIAAWRKSDLRYTGIDLFEARPAAEPKLTLRAAHTELRSLQVQARLVPGDPYAALVRVANTLAHTDLLLISANHDPQSLSRAWTYVPRMLTANSLVFLEEPGREGTPKSWTRITMEKVQELAGQAARSQRLAA